MVLESNMMRCRRRLRKKVARRVYTVHGMDWGTGYMVHDIEYGIEHVHVHFKPGGGNKMSRLFCRLH
jgi:hypothetical protein